MYKQDSLVLAVQGYIFLTSFSLVTLAVHVANWLPVHNACRFWRRPCSKMIAVINGEHWY